MTRLAFVDTETTGLDPDNHEIWEVALIVREENGREIDYTWQLPVDLSRAEAIALNIGKFHERRWESHRLTSLDKFAKEFSERTWGTHLVGAVISFDEERLRRLLHANGQTHGWHYHLIDVEALMVGKMDPSPPPPWKSRDLSLAFGIDPSKYEEHTALGDAWWARDIYDRVMATWRSEDARDVLHPPKDKS